MAYINGYNQDTTLKMYGTVITSDWFLAITVFDMSLFTLLCLIWLVRDMKQHNKSSLKIILMVLACIITGVVALLAYLAFRGQPPLSPKGGLPNSH